jgi:hypothetical protein
MAESVGMKMRLLEIVACATALAASPAAAITYNVNDAAGSLSVTGSITTNGAVGILQQTDITDWSLSIFDGLTTQSLLGPLSGANSFIGAFNENALTAQRDGLLHTDLNFDWYYFFGPPGALIIQSSSSPLTAIQWNSAGIGGGFTLILAGFQQFTPRSGSQSIAHVAETPVSAVPLPPSAVVHLTGLGLLGLLAWRRKRKAATQAIQL